MTAATRKAKAIRETPEAEAPAPPATIKLKYKGTAEGAPELTAYVSTERRRRLLVPGELVTVERAWAGTPYFATTEEK